MINPSLFDPIDYKNANPAAAEVSAAAVARLKALFYQQIEKGLHPGAQLVVLRYGRVIFDGAAGLANKGKGLPVTQNTPFLIFSGTKAFTAVCIHHLIEAGKLQLDTPVAEYWPAFGKKGKAKATIRHTLLHQAGIPVSGMPWQPLIWHNSRLMAQHIASLSAEWEPGSKMVYHLVNSGFILGELIYRVSGLSPQAYLNKHFIQPLGMTNTFTGLPYRQQGQAAHIYTADPNQANAAFLFNRAIYRKLFIPAASINTTARDLAVFYQMLANGGVYAGKHYLKPETIRQAAKMEYDGPNTGTDRRIRWSPGFTVGGYSEFPDEDIRMMGKGSTVQTFGHPGQGGASLAWADPASGFVFAYLNNQFPDAKGVHRRAETLANAVWDLLN